MEYVVFKKDLTNYGFHVRFGFFFFPEKNLIGEKDVTREMAFLTNTLKKLFRNS